MGRYTWHQHLSTATTSFIFDIQQLNTTTTSTSVTHQQRQLLNQKQQQLDQQQQHLCNDNNY